MISKDLISIIISDSESGIATEAGRQSDCRARSP